MPIPVFVDTDDCEVEEVCSQCLMRPPVMDTLCAECLFGTTTEGERADQDFGSDY